MSSNFSFLSLALSRPHSEQSVVKGVERRNKPLQLVGIKARCDVNASVNLTCRIIYIFFFLNMTANVIEKYLTFVLLY